MKHGASAKALKGALSVAADSGCDACLDLLAPTTDKSAAVNALLYSDIRTAPARVKRLLDLGADPNVIQDGKPLLMWLATTGSTEKVRLLLEHGADVNAKSAEGHTALDYALRQGDTPVVTLLRKFGAVEGRPAPIVPSPDPAPSSRAAIARSLPILQRADVTFMRKSGCVSCHNDLLTGMTMASVRERNLTFDQGIARSQVKAIGDYIDGNRERYLQGISIAGEQDTTSYILAGLAAEGFLPSAATDAMARFVRSQQEADGSWSVEATRPPIESSSIAITALCLRALDVYAPAPQRQAYRESVRRAAAWLESAQAFTNEDRSFQLLGLTWAGYKPDRIRKIAAALIGEQRSDGGWAQISSLGSDAYATGQALVALKTAGVVSPADPAFRRGVTFLLQTQMQDGSWYVRSRAVALQPYFDSGFPYGADQFISAAATNWAAMALAGTM